MNNYYWTGINKQGIKVFGEMSAGSISTIKSELIKKSIKVIKIKKKRKKFFMQKITHLEISEFFKNLSLLISSHIPLVRSLNILSKNIRNPTFKALVQTISSDISSGISFSSSLRKHENIFSYLTIELATHSELSGNFSATLHKLANHLEKNEKIKKRIKKALLYPSIILLTVLMTIILMLVFLIPEFEKLFATYHTELPHATLFIIHLSKYFKNKWHLIIICLFSTFTSLKIVIKFSLQARNIIDKALIHSTFFGTYYKKIIIAYTFRALSISLSSNLPIITSLKSIQTISKNRHYQSTIEQVINEIKSGNSLHQALQNHSFFPNIIIQMTAVGEELGILDQMLSKISDKLDEDIDMFFENLNSILEPIIMLFLGLFVGGFLLTMYLPIFKLGSVF